MTAQTIDGKQIATQVRSQCALYAQALGRNGIVAGLAVVLVGDHPASQIYVRNKTRTLLEAGLETFDHRLPATTTEAELLTLIDSLNRNHVVDGILVQLPLPKQISSQRVLDAISPVKDVDGFHPKNVGLLWSGRPRFVPCTPLGIMVILKTIFFSLPGKNAVVIGRSHIVGRPMAALLLAENATVTLCHSQTRSLAEHVAGADLVVAAAGSPKLVRGDWIKPGAVVIDVGMNRIEGGRLVGDVDFAEASLRASAITPVPGGVGPMTIALLLYNTLMAAGLRRQGIWNPFL